MAAVALLRVEDRDADDVAELVAGEPDARRDLPPACGNPVPGVVSRGKGGGNGESEADVEASPGPIVGCVSIPLGLVACNGTSSRFRVKCCRPFARLRLTSRARRS